MNQKEEVVLTPTAEQILVVLIARNGGHVVISPKEILEAQKMKLIVKSGAELQLKAVSQAEAKLACAPVNGSA